MISRVAEGCFWLGRYLERMETLARVMDVHHALHIDACVPTERRWPKLLGFAGRLDEFVARYGEVALGDGERVQAFLTWDEEQPGSLYGDLRQARENLRTVREIASLEAWKAINDLWLWLQSEDAGRLHETDRSAFYERFVRATHLFHGVSFATMLHDEPFSFLKLGRAVERAGLTARILDSHADYDAPDATDAESAARWLAILRCCCAYDPFFLSGIHPLSGRTVTRFLLFDSTLPCSLLYNLNEARHLLIELRQGDPIGLPRRSWTDVGRLRGELLQMDISDVERLGVRESLAWMIRSIDRLCDAIHDDFLDPPTAWLRHCVRAVEAVEGPAEGTGRAA